MDSSNLQIAIVGATGAVGAVALQLLAERQHPANNIRLLASKRSHGKQIEYRGEMLTVYEATPESFDGIDVAFISASSEVSLALAPEAVKRGVLVIDDGSAYRMEPTVPLVVPEVNGSDVEWHSGIISIPNCTTTPLVMALRALESLSKIESVTVSTYQSVTGTGAAARAELLHQSRDLLDGNDIAEPEQVPTPYRIQPIATSRRLRRRGIHQRRDEDAERVSQDSRTTRPASRRDMRPCASRNLSLRIRQRRVQRTRLR